MINLIRKEIPLVENFQVQNFGERPRNKRSSPKFNFYDFNLKYAWVKSSTDYLKLNLFRSADDFKNNYNFRVKDANENEVDLRVIEEQEWATNASSLDWSKSISPSWSIRNTAHFTQYNIEESNDIGLGKKTQAWESTSYDKKPFWGRFRCQIEK